METGITHHSNEEQRTRIWEAVYAAAFLASLNNGDAKETAAMMACEAADAARDSIPATTATMTIKRGGG